MCCSRPGKAAAASPEMPKPCAWRARSTPLRQHPVQRQLRAEAGLLQPLRHLARHVASAGQLVRTAGVVEKLAALAQHARELVVEGLRIQFAGDAERSEEHTSELQSRENLVCRLLLVKKK